MLPPEKGFPRCELEQHPGADPAMVGSELRFSQGTKIGKRGTGDAKQDRGGGGGGGGGSQKRQPSRVPVQTAENTNCLAHALHALCFALALSFPIVSGSPGRLRNNISLGLPGKLIQSPWVTGLNQDPSSLLWGPSFVWACYDPHHDIIALSSWYQGIHISLGFNGSDLSGVVLWKI